MKPYQTLAAATLLLTVSGFSQTSFTDLNTMAFMHETSQPVFLKANSAPVNKLKVPQVNCSVQKMSDQVNGQYTDYTPVLTPDEHTLFFTSRRPGNIGHKKNIDNSWKTEDIYYSTLNADGTWNTATLLPGNVNTNKNEAITSLSADGTRMLICRNEDIYESELVGGTWSKPHPFTAINSDYRETHASFANDGNTVFFTTNNPEVATVGGLDICMVTKNADGSWSDPVLVNNVNTPLNEEDPTLMADGKTFYFSSQGFSNLGGYDIFSSTLQNGTFSQPENLGTPINSASNEPFISIINNGKKALFSSDRADSNGVQSLYSAVFFDKIQVPYTLQLVNAQTLQPVSGTVQVNGLGASGKQTVSGTTYQLTGLTLNHPYQVNVSANGYDSSNVVLHTPSYDQFHADSTYTMVVYLNPTEVKKTHNKVIGVIGFDYAKSNIKSGAPDLMLQIRNELANNPNARVSISAHTDNTGSSTYNYTLSQARANAIVTYLVANGVDQSRLTAKGFGEEKPLVANDTESNRAKNRRAEIEIVFE